MSVSVLVCFSCSIGIPQTKRLNKMGKTRDLLKNIIDTMGTFRTRMGTIKVRNGKDLTEVEEIKNRWQDYIE